MAAQDITSQPSVASAPAVERDRFKSPPPLVPAMTPPPTSEPALLASRLARTPSPKIHHLSSPPLTTKSPILAPHFSSEPSTGMYSSQQVAQATSEELRTMMDEAMTACREARTAAAHHKLQYQLLSMESSESMKRMQVELEMTQKEVEVLQARGSSALATPVMSVHNVPTSGSPNDRIILDLRNAYQLLEIENEHLRRRLSDAKIALMDREDTLLDEIERLRERIRENRSHMTLFRRSLTMPDNASTMPSTTPFATPSQPLKQEPKTPNNPRQISSAAKAQGDQAFAALLLADQVLSQEAATTPDTPHGRHSKSHGRSSTRVTRLGSPFPATNPQILSLAPSPYFVAANKSSKASRNTPLVPQSPINPAHLQRRRVSRDSTISASDLDGREGFSGDEIPTLDTSEKRPATDTQVGKWTRRSAVPLTPTKSAAALPKSSATGSGSKGYTSRASEKMKRKTNDEAVGEGKKLKLSEGVGLGIGGLGGVPNHTD